MRKYIEKTNSIKMNIIRITRLEIILNINK